MRAEQLLTSLRTTADGENRPFDVIQHFIISPHFDDEVIGCYEILRNAHNKNPITVIPCMFDDGGTSYSLLRMEESRNALKVIANGDERIPNICMIHPVLPMEIYSRIGTICQEFLIEFGKHNCCVCWFPDPLYEDHPHHKLIGEIGLHYANVPSNLHSNILCGLYSVNMRAPYVHTLSQSDQRIKQMACQKYVSQSEYFSSHGEATIFEGRIIL